MGDRSSLLFAALRFQPPVTATTAARHGQPVVVPCRPAAPLLTLHAVQKGQGFTPEVEKKQYRASG